MRSPQPTDEELRSAWQRCRKPSWPASFEAAMEHPLLSRLVRITALHPPRAHRKHAGPAPTREPVFAPKPRPRDARSISLPGFPAGHVDRKRAAAGERDDD